MSTRIKKWRYFSVAPAGILRQKARDMASPVAPRRHIPPPGPAFTGAVVYDEGTLWLGMEGGKDQPPFFALLPPSAEATKFSPLDIATWRHGRQWGRVPLNGRNVLLPPPQLVKWMAPPKLKEVLGFDSHHRSFSDTTPQMRQSASDLASQSFQVESGLYFLNGALADAWSPTLSTGGMLRLAAHRGMRFLEIGAQLFVLPQYSEAHLVIDADAANREVQIWKWAKDEQIRFHHFARQDALSIHRNTALRSLMAEAGKTNMPIETFRDALYLIDRRHGRVFQNLTGTGRRLSQQAMSRELGVQYVTVRSWEGQLRALCADRGWQVTFPVERAEAVRRGRELQPQVDRLIERAVKESLSQDEFESTLRAIDTRRAEVFANLLTQGMREAPYILARALGLHGMTVCAWEKAFEKVCRVRGWAVAPVVSGRREDNIRKVRLQNAVEELIARVPIQSPSREEFETALREIDFRRAVVFANLTTAGERKSQRRLAMDLRLSRQAIEDWEKRFKSVCKTMGWEVTPISWTHKDMAEVSRRGKQLKGPIDDLFARAQTTPLSRDAFEQALRAIDPRHAAVFANLMIPEGRLSHRGLVKQLEIAEWTVMRWERQMLALCEEKGWPVRRYTRHAEAIRQGKQLEAQVVRLMASARDKGLSQEQLEAALREIDPRRAKVFANLVTRGDRVSQGSLARVLGKDSTAIGKWEKSLEVLCRDMGWAVTPMPAARRAGADAVQKGIMLRNKVNGIMAQIGRESWSREAFAEALRPMDAVLSAVFDNLAAGGNRVPMDTLASRFNANGSTLGRWERRFIRLYNDMGWPVTRQVGLARAIGNGRALQVRTERLIARAQTDKLSRDDFEAKLRAIDPRRAEVFADLTTSGVRRSVASMAMDMKVSTTTIQSWQKVFVALCEEMVWPVTKVSDERRVMLATTRDGKVLHQKMDELVRQARSGALTRDQLVEQLREMDSRSAAVFDNLTTTQERKSRKDMAVALRVAAKTVADWEKKLESLCAANGWEVAPIPEERRLLDEAAKKGKTLKAQVIALMTIARTAGETFTQGMFERKLRGIDPGYAKVLANLTTTGGRKSSLAMSKMLGVSLKAVTNWESTLEGFCREMGWKIADRSGRVVAVSRGIEMQRQVGDLIERVSADGATWSPERFLGELQGIDATLARVFEGLTTIDGRKSRLSIAQAVGGAGPRLSTGSSSWKSFAVKWAGRLPTCRPFIRTDVW